MFARGGKILVIIALVLTTGAHWIALQTVAWTTMLAANMSCENFSAAVAQTFDGNHKCPLCCAIAAAKKAEKKSAAVAPALKMEFPPVTEKIVLVAPRAFRPFAPEKFSADFLPAKPPLPPPRSLFA